MVAVKVYNEAVDTNYSADLIEPQLLSLFINFPLVNRVDIILSALKKDGEFADYCGDEKSSKDKLDILLENPKCCSIYAEFEKARKDHLLLLQDELRFLKNVEKNLTDLLKVDASIQLKA